MVYSLWAVNTDGSDIQGNAVCVGEKNYELWKSLFVGCGWWDRASTKVFLSPNRPSWPKSASDDGMTHSRGHFALVPRVVLCRSALKCGAPETPESANVAVSAARSYGAKAPNESTSHCRPRIIVYMIADMTTSSLNPDAYAVDGPERLHRGAFRLE